jgi:hypothetical protein
MRTNDPDPQPFQPLGEKVVKPEPLTPEWKPLSHNASIEQGRDGKLRTNQPLPKG